MSHAIIKQERFSEFHSMWINPWLTDSTDPDASYLLIIDINVCKNGFTVTDVVLWGWGGGVWRSSWVMGGAHMNNPWHDLWHFGQRNLSHLTHFCQRGDDFKSVLMMIVISQLHLKDLLPIITHLYCILIKHRPRCSQKLSRINTTRYGWCGLQWLVKSPTFSEEAKDQRGLQKYDWWGRFQAAVSVDVMPVIRYINCLLHSFCSKSLSVSFTRQKTF